MNTPEFEPVLADALNTLGIQGRVLAAVSGGADSVALVRGLVTLRDRQGLELGAAHLNHQLRGKESTADAAFVRQLCASLNVALVDEQTDVRRVAAEQGIGIEEAARNARYDFFIRAAREQHCPWVLVAHTADDQVETVLHHLLRGTGIDGLRGIPATRPLAADVMLGRPLLNIGRALIEAYLRALPQDWREDASNRDTSLTRNRIRHVLLPVLREQFNPHLEAAIVNLSQQAVATQAVVEHVAAELFAAACLATEPDVVRLDASKLATAVPHLVCEVLRLTWRRQDWPLGGMTFAHWSAAADVAIGLAKAIDLPGRVRVERRGTLLVLSRRS
ncbi:MAG: tRNA lysidine(34) synthetase TilS [Planctomycetaceae bacterium]|nr:tRNA lysidine(34) synthetase TilS [Planctomycetaceae bacterium]